MMSYSKIIHEYLDTGVDGSTEEMLFAELASDEALRSEFNRQVQLHLIAQSDMNSISPPMDVTSGVFKSLGFEIPTNEFNSNIATKAAVAGSAGSANGPMMTFWKKHFSTIMVAVIASLITAAIFYTSQEFGSGFGDNQSLAGQADNNTSSKNSFPVISSFEDSDSQQANEFAAVSGSGNKSGIDGNSAFNNRVNNIINNRSASNNRGAGGRISGQSSRNGRSFAGNRQAASGSGDNDPDKHLSGNLSLASNSRQVIADISSLNSANSYANGQSPAQALGIKDPTRLAQNSFNPYGTNVISIPASGRRSSLFDDLVDNIDNTKWGVTVRGISVSDASLNNRLANSNNWLDNANVEVLYKFDQYWGMSVDFGRENIAQAFTGTIAGKAYDFAQNPALYWYGISGLLRLPDIAILSGIVPFAKLTIGGTAIGPIGRFQTGLRVRFYENIRLVAALESTGLFYNVDGINYSTGKLLGFTYGISYGF